MFVRGLDNQPTRRKRRKKTILKIILYFLKICKFEALKKLKIT